MLRDYQTEAVAALRRSVGRYGSALYVLPTGGGKTVVAGEIARLAQVKGSRTLFLVHRRELVAQAVETMTSFCPEVSIGVECSGWPRSPWATLQVGMVQSLARRDDVREPDLIIVDEAHHARAKTWADILARFDRASRIGLTATPQRLDGRGLGEHFADMVIGPTIADLVADGSLAPTRMLSVPSGLDLSGVRRTRTGEFREADVAAGVTERVVANAAVAYHRYSPGRRGIFFGVNRAHSQAVCQSLRESGYRAEHVDGADHVSRRARIMREFRDGAIDVVGNCDLISEGFDAPACDVVLMGSPTASITRYLQMAGRAMRPGEGKTALILDLVGNAGRHGHCGISREWSLEDGEVNAWPGSETDASDRSVREGDAREIRPPAEIEVPLVEMELTPSKGSQPPRRAAPMASRREINAALQQARLAPDPRRALEAIAMARHYKPGWVHHILRVWGLHHVQSQ